MPDTYEHVNDEGTVTQRVTPVQDSPNHRQLRVKAADKESGWRLAEEPAAAPTEAAGSRLRKTPATSGTGAPHTSPPGA